MLSRQLEIKGDTIDYVSSVYHVETYKRVCAYSIKAVSSEVFWEPTNYPPPKPPTIRRRIGRPKKQQKCDSDEPWKNPKIKEGTSRLKRRQTTIKCGCCGVASHNATHCPSLNPQHKDTTMEDGETMDEGATSAEHLPATEEQCGQTSVHESAPGVTEEQIDPATQESTANVACRRVDQITQPKRKRQPMLPLQRSTRNVRAPNTSGSKEQVSVEPDPPTTLIEQRPVENCLPTTVIETPMPSPKCNAEPHRVKLTTLPPRRSHPDRSSLKLVASVA
ncbi:uncharacterized protein LOC127258487 [Andrographis paniculata]|uniref:uncharacterized protein LOC127258487 n=1 Tax=Andrographis paniculata TaxID=175694 RepID=UPI0021E9169A|nr:uncharacterized protein LOC127258487 [Andrographis paniculata]